MKAFGLSTHLWYILVLASNLYTGSYIVLHQLGVRLPVLTKNDPQMGRVPVEKWQKGFMRRALAAVDEGQDYYGCEGKSWAALLPISPQCSCTYDPAGAAGALSALQIGRNTVDLHDRWYEISVWGVRYEVCDVAMAMAVHRPQDWWDSGTLWGRFNDEPNAQMIPREDVPDSEEDGIAFAGRIAEGWHQAPTGQRAGYKIAATRDEIQYSVMTQGYAIDTSLVFAYLAIWSSLLLINEARRGKWPEKGSGRSGNATVNSAYYVALCIGVLSFAGFILPTFSNRDYTLSDETIADEQEDGVNAKYVYAHASDTLILYEWVWGLHHFDNDGSRWVIATVTDLLPGNSWGLNVGVFAAPLLFLGGVGGVLLLRAAGGFANKAGCCGAGCCGCRCCGDCCAPCCDVRKPEGEQLWLRDSTPSITWSFV